MQYVVFLILSPVTAVTIVITMVMVGRRPRSSQTVPMLCALWSSLGFLVVNTLELLWPTEEGTMLFAKLGYPFSMSLPVFLFLFTAAFTAHENWFAGARIIPLFLVPAATSVLVATEPLHGLIWASVSFHPFGGMLVMSVAYGWFFWVAMAYCVLLLVLCAVLILREHSTSPRLYRRQSALVLIGVFVPLALHLIYILKLIPGFTKNFSPITYSVAALLFVAGMRQFKFLDLVPIARGIVVDEMADGMLVVDLVGRIVDVNRAAKAMLGISEGDIGSDIARFPVMADAVASGSSGGHVREVALGAAENLRWYDARVSPLFSRTSEPAGSVVLLRDVTETHALIEEKSRLIEELSQAAVEIETLQGIIPICMYCKKVRDDTGYWHQVESYVSKRSKAQFSHGLCPDCQKRLEEQLRETTPPLP